MILLPWEQYNDDDQIPRPKQKLDEFSSEFLENIQDRVFHVLISSAGDMQRERERLVLNVFPRFRKRCAARNVEFVLIDLHRDATSEPKLEGKKLGTFLREIQRARSVFIGLSGEKYGTIPRKTDICERDFLNFPFLKEDVANGLSVTEIEFQFGALRETAPVEARFWLRSKTMKKRVGIREKDANLLTKLTDLKAMLYAQDKYPVAEYDSLEDLDAQVEKALNELLDKYFPENQRLSWFQSQDAEQNAFEASVKDCTWKIRAITTN